ncbi:MAG: DUF4157 domain-containing protein [Bacteroidia bacterium]|nr:DUF4157 domain-containing protein [Bacteroidia bacterium]
MDQLFASSLRTPVSAVPASRVHRMCAACDTDSRPRVSLPAPGFQTRTGAVQFKLTVGAPNDVYEQEADQVASQVLSMPDTAVQRIAEEEEPIQMKPAITPLVQRANLMEEEEIQTKPLVQRAGLEEEELQMKPMIQRTGDGSFQADDSVTSRIEQSSGGGDPLPAHVQAYMEPRFGADLSQVRVHTGGDSVQLNRELGAQAFTHGNDVYFGEGKSPGNDALTAHELTHVIQQGGGH